VILSEDSEDIKEREKQEKKRQAKIESKRA